MKTAKIISQDDECFILNIQNMENCSNCKFWRDKGWDEKGNGTGICDNPKVIEEVSMLDEEVLKKFVKGSNDNEKKWNARFIHNSLRFSNKFYCKHHILLKRTLKNALDQDDCSNLKILGYG